MSCDQIEEIIRISNQNPSAFALTLSCLERRAKILKDVEANCNDHDSLVSQYKTNYIRTLENCDLMIERVFERERLNINNQPQVKYVVPAFSRV